MPVSNLEVIEEEDEEACYTEESTGQLRHGQTIEKNPSQFSASESASNNMEDSGIVRDGSFSREHRVSGDIDSEVIENPYVAYDDMTDTNL